MDKRTYDQCNVPVVTEKRTKKRRHKLCHDDDCAVIPKFNYKGQVRGMYCAQHKKPGMVDVINKRCQDDGCSRRPSFNYAGQKHGVFCSQHKKSGMIDVVTKRCQDDGCTSIPVFNYDGQRGGVYCSQHKKSEMVDVVNKRCQDDGCIGTRPVFNYYGQKRGVYCFQHKNPGMVDVRNKHCQDDRCTGTRATFNFEGQTQGIYCTMHKKSGMLDVVTRRCQHDGCAGWPINNYVGQRKGLFCAKHKKPSMINVVTKRCQHDGCTSVQPSYNYVGQRKGVFCGQHKKPGMMNVKSKRCQDDDCNTSARYGKPGHEPRVCFQHREPDMIVNPKKRCMEVKCSEIAIYGILQATHCVIHRLNGEDNLVGQSCIKCGLIDIVNDSQECETCDTRAQNLHKRLRLAKQRQVKVWLDSEPDLNGYELYDRIIDGGTCGLERPDFLYDCGTHAIVLEIDEHQHNGGGYTEWCTCSRMINIGQSKGMPVVFIRYNPDHYKTCGKQASISTRRDVLFRWLRFLKTRPPNYFSSVYQLFYDGYDESNVQEHCIQAFENKVA